MTPRPSPSSNPKSTFAFGPRADQLVASLLAHAAAQQPLADKRPKKVAQASRPCASPRSVRSRSACSVRLVLYLTTLYCGPAQARTGKGARVGEGAGIYPELSALGISEGSSPALVSLVGRQAPCSSSYQASRATGVTHAAAPPGHQGRSPDRSSVGCRRADLPYPRPAALARRPVAGRSRVGRSARGRHDRRRADPAVRTMIRKQKGWAASGKKQRRRYQAEWREPKLLIVFEIDDQGRLQSPPDGSLYG